MFKVGDRVVYPMHGAGVIEAIEEKEILGKRRQYYVMRLPMGDIKLMIPTDTVAETGLREVISQEEVAKVLDVLQEREVTMSANWNRRYRANLEKIKSGNIFEVAEVVRNLVLREREKGLSTGERRMLDSARQILISELVLAQDKEEEEVTSLLDGILA
ncbi:MAG: CarD family transcriptional regulator [Clostridia bacterium]|nr:CarD family transcriptional regulator [Clostridia bacterium]